MKMDLVSYNSLFSPLIVDEVWDRWLADFPVSKIQTTGFPVYDHYCDQDGNYVVEFALAGYKTEDLKVSVEGSNLVVSSAGSSEVKSSGLRRIAKRSFKQSFTDRNNVYDLHNLKVSFVDGILKIVLSKKAEAREKVFKIENK